MADNKEDLLSKWLEKRMGGASGASRSDAERSAKIEAERISVSREASERANEPARPSKIFSPPLLSGKLADFLKDRQPRHIQGDGETLTSRSDPFQIDDVQTRAVVAMSVILAGHLTRFASTTLSEASLAHVRDRLMRTFSAHDAVRIEIEAYDLLNWFAGAMNDSWEMSTSVTAVRDESQCLQNHVAMLERAIREHRDLEMRYYTGTRGEFSTRRISPIKISAEKYLIAYCYSRKEERKFRLSRILSLSWVDSVAADDELSERDRVAGDGEDVVLAEASVVADGSAYEEDDLREITALGTENDSPILPKHEPDGDESVPVVRTSGGWVPESKVEGYKRDRGVTGGVQATLPGMNAPEAEKPAPEKPKNKAKKNTTGFLPGFEI